jgi:5'-phosphate synthase pdxT subunit
MDKLLRQYGLAEPLRHRIAAGLPTLATCAGVILLADEVRDGLPDQESLRVLPVAVRRNAYGRQVESFEVPLRLAGLEGDFPGVFIRAPSIESWGEGVETLAELEGRPVAVRHGNVIGLVFHPELTADRRVHGLFLDVAEAARRHAEMTREHGRRAHGEGGMVRREEIA